MGGALKKVMDCAYLHIKGLGKWQDFLKKGDQWLTDQNRRSLGMRLQNLGYSEAFLKIFPEICIFFSDLMILSHFFSFDKAV